MRSFKRNFDMKKYTKEQILIAAEIGEVSMIDARHIVSLLDEAVIFERERKLHKHDVSGSVCDECTDGSGWYGCEDITYNCSKCNPEAK